MFKDILKGKVVIVGIGNIMRGDDSFGPELVKRLNGCVDAVCIDAGTAPENYTGKIKKESPDTILIADAVHLDLAPGGYRILKKDDILKCGFTTHDISPNMLIEYLEKETGADIYMLGIQPKHLSFGEEMSEEVKKALGDIIKSIAEA
jgi:hydrogenase 3 maturation protease